jgi:hypothetical protein
LQQFFTGAPLSYNNAKVRAKRMALVVINIFPITGILGEASANLGGVLEALAIDIEKQQHFRAKVSAAMIYPVLLLLVLLPSMHRQL